jgi:hypothetical protein
LSRYKLLLETTVWKPDSLEEAKGFITKCSCGNLLSLQVGITVKCSRCGKTYLLQIRHNPGEPVLLRLKGKHWKKVRIRIINAERLRMKH